MKRITLLITFLLTFVLSGNAQLFRVATCNGTIASNTYGPMNSVATVNATNITASIYPSSQLTGIAGQILNAVYFNRITATGTMAGTPNFKVYLKETTATDFGASAITWATELTGATLVYDSNPATSTGSSAGWKAFPFSTNFTYSGTQNLAVYMEYSNTTASATIGWEYEYSAPCISTTNSNTTKYSNNTTGVLATATTATNYRRPQIGFDFVVSCNAPTALTSSAVGTVTADLSWTAPTVVPADGYEYYYSTTNTAPLPATTPSGSTAAGVTTVSLSGLSSGTNYYAWVRSNCGPTDKSIWKGVASFTTLCLPITTLPWTENFDTLATGDQIFPPCWASFNTASVWNIETTPVAQSGANSLGRTWSTDGWAFTPLATLTAGTSYTFSYYMKAFDTTAPGYDVTVAVGNSQTVAGMTTTLNTVTGHTNATWTKFTHTFTPTSTGDYSFGVRALVTVSAPNGINFDTFKLELTPTCVEPTALVVSNIAPTTADVSWTAPTVAPADGYEYYYSTTNTAPDAATTPQGGAPAGVTTASLSGLNPSTTYYVWVRSACSGSDKSAWSQSTTFTTLCLAFAAPFTEPFGATLPNCWTRSGSENWLFANTGSGNHIGNNGVITGTTTSNDYFAWVDDSSPSSTDATLTSPMISLTGLTNPRLTFYEISNNEGANPNSTLNVEVWNGTAWTNVGVFTGNTVGGWEKKIINLSSLTITGDIQVRFILNESASFYDDIAIDDVTIEESPLCSEPTLLVSSAVTSASADISWTAPLAAPADGYEYYYSTTNTAPDAATTPQGGAPAGVTTASLASLTPDTLYYVWVRSACSGSDKSSWSQSTSFRTLCLPMTTLPWTENFDALTAGTNVFPPCWAYTNTTSTWSISTTPAPANSGANMLRRTWSTDGWAFTPPATLTAGTSYTFSYFVKTNDTTVGYDVTIGAGIGQNAAAMTAINSVTGYQGPAWVKVSHVFVPTVSGDYSFGIHVVAPSAPNGINFDDFKIELTPACVEPTSVTASSVTPNAATISWNAGNGAVNYEYVLDNTATDPIVAGTLQTAVTYSATGLTPQTLYYFHVRTVCSGGNTIWSTTSFTTPALPPANDNCANAIALTNGAVFADNAVVATNVGATNSNPPAPGCASFAGGDVWYAVTVPASGSITIETGNDTAAGSTITDTGMAVYSGTCTGLTLVECDDDDSADGNFSKIALTGRTAGEILYINAWEYSNDTFGTFKVSAYDASLSASSFDTANFYAVPNPVKDILKLSYNKDITSVSVYNIIGQEMMTKTINATQSQIDMSHLAAGTYMVRVTADSQVKTIKIVKE